MSAIDDLIELGQGDVRSLDSILVVPMSKNVSQEDLIKGAIFAQNAYPKSGRFPVDFVSKTNLSDFINSKLKNSEKIEQLIFEENSERFLATKMSHKLCDGLSMFLWIKAQLFQELSQNELVLRKFPTKKDTPFRKITTTKTWPIISKKISERRSFVYSVFKTTPERLNDRLCLGLLKTLGEKSSLWLPANVRKVPKAGFGNGLSRLRLYPPKKKLTDREFLDFISLQKKQSFQNGEIFLPNENLKLTDFKKNIFNLWLNRPWADWCSLSFSHMTKTGFKNVIGIPPISPKHQAVIFATTEGDETFITLAFDELNVSIKEAEDLIKNWRKNFNELDL